MGVPGDFVEHRLESDPGFQQLGPADRRLAQELVYGVLRQRSVLDWIVARRTDGRPQKPALQDLLRLGLYQLLFLDRIPAHAAVHETVELGRANGFPQQAGFLNAVLRGVDRERDRIRSELAQLAVTDPATAWSHPDWLVERWRGRFGMEGLRRLLEWDNTPPPTFVRVNRLRCSTAALLERWQVEGVEVRPVERDWIPEGSVFELVSHPPLTAMGTFRDGCFYVQDPSTLLAVGVLDPKPGETVLDYCAAPGGKTVFMAERMENRGRIVAHDSHPARLQLVGENCGRLGVGCVERIGPPAVPVAAGGFDRVLVDAPCSNTGVLRRRLELRWRIQPAEIARLAQTQFLLLSRVAGLVRPGGVLVYSTCSLEAEENGVVAATFARQERGFELCSERQLDPVRDGVDGAYVAEFRRRPA